MPSGRSFYHRKPGRFAKQREDFQRLIAELKRLVLKHSYTREQIASELEVSPITVNNWWTGYSLTAKRESVERLKKFLAAH
jgi:transcriptional regulator with XRE-family HTH domain